MKKLLVFAYSPHTGTGEIIEDGAIRHAWKVGQDGRQFYSQDQCDNYMLVLRFEFKILYMNWRT